MGDWSQHAEEAAVAQIAEWLYELTDLSGARCERIAQRIVAMGDADWDGEE